MKHLFKFLAILALCVPLRAADLTTSANVDTFLGSANAAAMRTNIGATTVGANIMVLTNPSAITFLRLNADNTVTALSAANFNTALGLTALATTVPGTGVATFLATPSGANLATALTTALPDTKGGTGLTSLGTGVATFLGTDLTDPNADRLLFWDDSAGAFAYLTAGSGLSISGTTITATAAAGGSDTHVQYNDGGTALGGEAAFTYNKTNNTLTVENINVSGTATLGAISSAIYTEVAAPSTPASGTVVVYAKADGLIYGKDDAGSETVLSGGGSGATAYDDVADPDANSTIAFAGFTNLWTSSLDGGSVFSITNSDADAGTATYMLDIGYTDSPDAEANFIRLRTTIAGTPVVSYLFGSTAFTIDSTVATSFAGTVAVPTIAGSSDSDTSAASTAFVQAVAVLKANLAGGNTFTGTQVFPSGQALIAPALGTPASGVVTNLTGTASININGTVGATTPGTGAFTTLTTSGAYTLQENSSVALDPAGSADGKYTGTTVTGTAGYTQAFGDCVYLDPTDSRWELCDSNSAAGADGDSRGMVAMVVSTGTDGTACTLLLRGIIRADAKFPTFTVNNPVYISETAGSVTQTQPTTTDVVVRFLGAALTGDEFYFNPDSTWFTHN